MIRIVFFVLITLLISPALADTEKEDAALRLELVRVNLYVQMHQSDQALALLQQLKIRYPDNPQILAAEANIYSQAGYRGKTLSLLNTLASLAPANRELHRLKAEIMAVEAPFAAIEQSVRFTGSDITEYLTRFSGSLHYSPQLAVGAILENNNADAVTRVNGTVKPYKGNITRGELYTSYISDNGNQATTSLFLAEDVVGAGIWYDMLDNKGVSTLELNVQRPDWEFIEEVVNQGRRDKVQLSRTHLFTPRLSVNGSAALNRYGLEHETNVANSVAFSGDIRYNLLPLKGVDMVKYRASLQVDYTIDAEHPFHVEQSTDGDGLIFAPLPLESREVHSLTATFTQDIKHNIAYELFAGYAYDRLGGDGPLVGAYLSWWPLKKLALEGNISRRLRTENTTDSVDNIGVKGKWLF